MIYIPFIKKVVWICISTKNNKVRDSFVVYVVSRSISSSRFRPLVLFHETAVERAKEIDVPQRTLSRKADEFERSGMQSLFSSGEQGGERATSKTLPPEIRQLIVDLHAELPSMSWREIAEICYIQYGRRPAHHSVKHIATSFQVPSLQARRYQPWHQIPDPAERMSIAAW